jgi:hypothetical protein
MTMTAKKDNVVVTRIVEKDKMVGNFHLTLTSWRVTFRLCKFLFLQHHCDVNEQDSLSPMRDQIYTKGKMQRCFML